MCEWRDTTLGQLVRNGLAELQTGPFGTMLHASAYREIGTPVVAVKHIGENQLLHGDLPRIDDETVARLAKYKLRENDILFARKGSVSRRALVKSQEEGWVQGSDCIRLRLDSDRINPAFVAYLFGTQAHRTWMVQHAHGATMPSLNQQILELIPLSLPSKPHQDNIAHILGTLDDKIELNRRMNQTLEAIARAIFKSWFIDFDPVIDNALASGKPIPEELRKRAEIRAGQNQPSPLPSPIGRGVRGEGAVAYHRLFPDELQDSPLGKIPKGWEISHLADHITFALGGDWGKAAPDKTHTEPVYCIRGTDLPSLRQGHLLELRLRYLKAPSLQKRALLPFDIVFEVSGGSPTQSTGRSLVADEMLIRSYDRPLVCTNFCRLVRFSSAEIALFTAFLLDRLYSISEFFQHETGTTTIKNFAFSNFVKKFDIAFPDERTLGAFAELVAPILEARMRNSVESSTLSQTRDMLLPRLISGKLTSRWDKKLAATESAHED